MWESSIMGWGKIGGLRILKINLMNKKQGLRY